MKYKIKEEKKEWKPVTIELTFETERELELFTAMLGEQKRDKSELTFGLYDALLYKLEEV